MSKAMPGARDMSDITSDPSIVGIETAKAVAGEFSGGRGSGTGSPLSVRSPWNVEQRDNLVSWDVAVTVMGPQHSAGEQDGDGECSLAVGVGVNPVTKSVGDGDREGKTSPAPD